MPTSVASRCVALARAHPLHRPAIHYPDWYLRRWHFLPEGYLSERSVRLYSAYTRRVYWAFCEGRVLRGVVRDLGSSAANGILEIGCGPGEFLCLLGGLPGVRAAGLDLSPYMVEAAARRAPRATVRHEDATATTIEPGSFDVVLAAHVLGHVPAGVAEGMLAEARRVLRPGGRVCVVEHPWHPVAFAGWETVSTRSHALGLLRVRVLRAA